MKQSNTFKSGLALAAALAALVPAAGNGAEQYLLGVQDSLRIYVSEWPALSGEVVVGAGGEISLPVIGHIMAANLDTEQLGQLIAERLMAAEDLPELPNTAVAVTAYRPFYILGSVTSPGEYNYRPGMLVLNALSIAGGAYRAPDRSEWDMERVAIGSSGEISVLNLRYQDLLAEQMRLSAEHDGLEVLPAAPADADPQLARALAEQQAIFEGNAQRHLAARTSLQSSIDLLGQEIAVIDRQLANIATRYQSVEAELRQVRELARKDLAVQRLAPLETTFAEVQRQQQELEVNRLRAEQTLADLRRQFDDIDRLRQADLLVELQRVNAQLREVGQQRDAQMRLLTGASYYSAELASSAEDEIMPQLQYAIVRTEGETITQMEVTETARVLPGDIIKVFRALDVKPSSQPQQ